MTPDKQITNDSEYPASEGWTPEAKRQFEAGLRILARMIAADIIAKRKTKEPPTGGKGE